MGEFSPPLFLSPLVSLLMHRPQTTQPGFGSITLLQKFTPHFKILDPRLLAFFAGIEQDKRKQSSQNIKGLATPCQSGT